MDMAPTVQTIPRVFLNEAPSNYGIFRPLGSVYLAVADRRHTRIRQNIKTFNLPLTSGPIYIYFVMYVTA